MGRRGRVSGSDRLRGLKLAASAAILVGALLTVLLLVVSMIFLPLFWPLTP